MKGKKDPEILPIVLAGEHAFVTLDGRIVEEHNDYIPDQNPGVIVVALRRPTRTMTTRLGAHMLSEFKKRYKDWPREDTSGLKLEINETGIKLSRLKHSEKYFVIEYNIPDFEGEVKNKLDYLRGLAITPP